MQPSCHLRGSGSCDTHAHAIHISDPSHGSSMSIPHTLHSKPPVQIILGALWPGMAQMSNMQMLSLNHSCHTTDTEHTDIKLTHCMDHKRRPQESTIQIRTWDTRYKSYLWHVLQHIRGTCPSSICRAHVYHSHDTHQECTLTHVHTGSPETLQNL